jgi:hypothetical protein
LISENFLEPTGTIHAQELAGWSTGENLRAALNQHLWGLSTPAANFFMVLKIFSTTKAFVASSAAFLTHRILRSSLKRKSGSFTRGVMPERDEKEEIEQLMDELAREYGRTLRGDPRRSEISKELSGLCALLDRLLNHRLLN